MFLRVRMRVVCIENMGGAGLHFGQEMATTVTVPVPFEVKDPARKFTPLGRPFRRPRKVAASISSLSSNCNLDEFYFLQRPLLKPKTRVGPSPCSYTVPPPPRCDQGGKINPRAKYDRDLLPKPNYDLWTLNTRTLETAPSPCSYAVTNSIGGKNPSKKAGPAFSMRSHPTPRRKTKSEVVFPAPNCYNTAKSSDYVSRHFPSFTIKTSNSRKKSESSPGPAHYHPKHSFYQSQSPSFTFTSRSPTRPQTSLNNQ